jgi:hypothetical protein
MANKKEWAATFVANSVVKSPDGAYVEVIAAASGGFTGDPTNGIIGGELHLKFGSDGDIPSINDTYIINSVKGGGPNVQPVVQPSSSSTPSSKK